MSDTACPDSPPGSPSENGPVREYLPSGPVKGSDSPILGADCDCFAKKGTRDRDLFGNFRVFLRWRMSVSGTVTKWVYLSGRKGDRMGFSPWQAKKGHCRIPLSDGGGVQATTMKGDEGGCGGGDGGIREE
jgi:hypothetical protein